MPVDGGAHATTSPSASEEARPAGRADRVTGDHRIGWLGGHVPTPRRTTRHRNGEGGGASAADPRPQDPDSSRRRRRSLRGRRRRRGRRRHWHRTVRRRCRRCCRVPAAGSLALTVAQDEIGIALTGQTAIVAGTLPETAACRMHADTALLDEVGVTGRESVECSACAHTFLATRWVEALVLEDFVFEVPVAGDPRSLGEQAGSLSLCAAGRANAAPLALGEVHVAARKLLVDAADPLAQRSAVVGASQRAHGQHGSHHHHAGGKLVDDSQGNLRGAGRNLGKPSSDRHHPADVGRRRIFTLAGVSPADVGVSFRDADGAHGHRKGRRRGPRLADRQEVRRRRRASVASDEGGTSGVGSSSGSTCKDVYALCSGNFECCEGLSCLSGACRSGSNEPAALPKEIGHGHGHGHGHVETRRDENHVNASEPRHARPHKRKLTAPRTQA